MYLHPVAGDVAVGHLPEEDRLALAVLVVEPQQFQELLLVAGTVAGGGLHVDPVDPEAAQVGGLGGLLQLLGGPLPPALLGHPPGQQLAQLPPVQRLGDEVLEAVFQELLPHPLHGVGGQGNHGRGGAVFAAVLSDDLRRLDAVHHRHHMIHKDNVIPVLPHQFDGLRAALGLGQLEGVAL